MKASADQATPIRSNAAAVRAATPSKDTFEGVVDERPEALLQARWQELAAQHTRVKQLAASQNPVSNAIVEYGRVLQLVEIKGKINDAKILKSLDKKTLEIEVTDADIDPKDVDQKKLKKGSEIGANKLQALISAQLGKDVKFTITGNGINTIGDHTLKFGAVVINIKVTLKGGAKPLDEALKNIKLYEKKKGAEDIPEPPAAPKAAPTGMLFGTEFTFTNAKMYNEAKGSEQDGVQGAAVSENIDKQKKWKALLLSQKPEGLAHFEDQKDDKSNPVVKFTYKDGWWYKCSLDIACIETQTFKMSLGDAENRGWHTRIQRDIFDIAEKLGLHADKVTGGGHLHMDVQTTFGNDPLLFRAFLIDFCNNPLALEVLENDPTNSPVLAQLQEAQRAAFAKLMNNFHLGIDPIKRFGGQGEKVIEWLSGVIEKNVYKEAFKHLPFREQLDPPEKYQALNVRRIVDPNVKSEDKTLEIRAIRAQRTMEEFMLTANLLCARIRYLKSELQKGMQFKYDEKIARPIKDSDPQEVIVAFRQYVETAGLLWKDYEPLAVANMKERHKGFIPPVSPDSGEGALFGKGMGPDTDLKDQQPAQINLGKETENDYVVSELTRRTLNGLNLKEIPVKNDGDCFYRAVIVTENLGDTIQLLREKAAIEVSENWETYEGFATADKEALVGRIKTLNSYAGEDGDLSVVAIGNKLKLAISIIDNNKGIVAESQTPGRKIVLIRFTGNGLPDHYFGTEGK